MDDIVIECKSDEETHTDELVRHVISNLGSLQNHLEKIPAELMCERLAQIITDFEASLAPEKQAGAKIANFGNRSFLIDKVGYSEPDLITLSGTLPDGSPVQLVQHITQLNLLLVVARRMDDTSKPRRKIGFESPGQEPRQG